MNRRTLTPEELADERQHQAELVIRRDYESTTPAQRLARFEALEPSQRRPAKKPSIWDRVNFMEWETWEDLGLDPPAGEQEWWW